MSGKVVAAIRKNRLEEIRIGLSRFNGHDQLRVSAEPGNGVVERIPMRAGIAARVALLPQIIAALRKAGVEARRAGLLNTPIRSDATGAVRQRRYRERHRNRAIVTTNGHS
jgi:hypothetical protein